MGSSWVRRLAGSPSPCWTALSYVSAGYSPTTYFWRWFLTNKSIRILVRGAACSHGTSWKKISLRISGGCQGKQRLYLSLPVSGLSSPWKGPLARLLHGGQCRRTPGRAGATRCRTLLDNAAVVGQEREASAGCFNSRGQKGVCLK